MTKFFAIRNIFSCLSNILTFWRNFCKKRDNFLIIHNFICMKTAKIYTFGFPWNIFTEITLNLIILPVYLTCVKVVPKSRSPHNTLMQLFSYEGDFICVEVFFLISACFLKNFVKYLYKIFVFFEGRFWISDLKALLSYFL